jgi:hypothetical protein
MSPVKERLTVTLDPYVIEAGNLAVREGRADSISAWVNTALAERATREQRLRAMADAIAAFEAKFGPISPEDLAAQEREDRARARVVRGSTRLAKPRKTGSRRSG